jgi:hypothetical protein
MHGPILDKKKLREFGMTMGGAFLFISGLFLFRQKYTVATYSLIVSCIFSIIGLVLPVILRPVYIAWMRFAFILGWVNTRVILFILFYLIFTPLALLLRLFKVDLLERKNKADSYWKNKEKADGAMSDYERRF